MVQRLREYEATKSEMTREEFVQEKGKDGRTGKTGKTGTNKRNRRMKKKSNSGNYRIE